MKHQNILSPSARPCTGCGACAAACPHDAIAMRTDADGFFAPCVNEDKCTDCGLCRSVCYKFLEPSTCPDVVALADKPVVGTYSASREVQQTTTSGGFAYELARWGMSRGYKVYGVVYDYGRDVARAVLADNADELVRFKGSKYVQADPSALSALLADAKANPAGRYLCFGTPCQIFGLRRLIAARRLKNDFILIDLFCHGVPSYLVWAPYIAARRKQLGDLSSVDFRWKGRGWHQYTIHLEGSRGSYTGSAYRDTFYRYFFDNVALGGACFTCAVRKRGTAADLRIGDFLGGAYEHREDGISAVLVATPRGRKVLNALTGAGVLVADKQWPAQACLASQSTHDYGRRTLRDAVISRLRSGDNLHATQRWYFRHLPVSLRLRAVLKMAAALLPIGLLVAVRRWFRAVDR